MYSIKRENNATWDETIIKNNELSCRWIGQAGFIFRYGKYKFIIDPYLSDSLAIKYQDKKNKHIRTMPIPVQPSEIRELDWIFITHKHTDHMDIGTIPKLIELNPECRVYIPKATAEHAFNNVRIPKKNTIQVCSGERIQLSDNIYIEAIASAHEQLDCDENGNSYYLGYIIELGRIRIYHSGDCVPYDGLYEKLNGFNIDVALLPVNGRDVNRFNNNIPGNFHFQEAVELCRKAHIPMFIAHHFGMFDFNTIDPQELLENANGMGKDIDIIIPGIDETIIINNSN